jgi:lipoyl synthase
MLQQAVRTWSATEVAQQFEQALTHDPAGWRAAWQVRLDHPPLSIRFERPTATLPVSLTGTDCALQCAHCGGHYLEHMRPIWDVGSEAQVAPMRSLLISGGCDLRGRVPVTRHLEEVARLRAGRRLNWHVGLVDEETLRTIAPLVDVISFDIVGDAETAREVYGLDLTLDDYLRTFDLLCRYAPVVPHLTIGLRGGQLSGERTALEALRARAPHLAALILIVLIPTPGTAYADRMPPALPEVTDLLLEARVMLPDTRLELGCMRPHGTYRQALDELAVRAGLNTIVNPTVAAERAASALGLEIQWGDECCALE